MGEDQSERNFTKNVLFVPSAQMLLVNRGLCATLSSKTHCSLAICLWTTN